MSEFILPPPDRALRLRNLNCPYCGRTFSDTVITTVEHVIGRRFIPKGNMNANWNLILNACDKCNGEKAILENDISVITMMTRRPGSDESQNLHVNNEIARRAYKSGSPRTGRAVASSHEGVTLKLNGPSGMGLRLSFEGPPQIDHERISRLAVLHFMAFFFYVSYDEKTRMGSFPGEIRLLGSFGSDNWGADDAKWFMALDQSWDLRFCGVSAEGFFKISIRRCPDAPVWAFAVEWNQSVRVLGFGGNSTKLKELEGMLPAKGGNWAVSSNGHPTRITESVSLDERDDTLFVVVEHDDRLGLDT